MAEAREIAATSRRPERVAELEERYEIAATLSNRDAAANASLVVIAVKPQDIEGLLGEIGGLISPDQTVLTVAAAIQTSRIESRLSAGVPVVRAMPNTPSTVHEGIAGLCAGAHAGDEHLDLAEEALSHLGGVVRVPESAMDAITAVSGSGPAYFALLAEAMIEAGILLGLSREISTQLVVQTMLGTAKQLRDEKMHPVELREMVTSPGGTTIAAIRELEMAGVRAAFLNAIQAAMVRARELAAGQDQAPVDATTKRSTANKRHSPGSPFSSATPRRSARRPARPRVPRCSRRSRADLSLMREQWRGELDGEPPLFGEDLEREHGIGDGRVLEEFAPRFEVGDQRANRAVVAGCIPGSKNHERVGDHGGEIVTTLERGGPAHGFRILSRERDVQAPPRSGQSGSPTRQRQLRAPTRHRRAHPPDHRR